MTIALFPGQGVQAPGMDAGLTEIAADVFAAASAVFGLDIGELCREGRTAGASLDSTLWAQPAVLTCGVAAFEALRRQGLAFTAVAGHSVGEYAALVCGGALELSDALRLMALRAQATEDASRINPCGMLAVMRIDRAIVEQICASVGVSLAADNSSGQLVLSGPREALDAARSAAEEQGATCRSLDVAGAFHSPAMEPAAAPLTEALGAVTFADPRIEVWSPTTVGVLRDSASIDRVLIDQLTTTVRFRETVEAVASEHGTSFTDIGPGRVVGGLAKRIVKGAEIAFAADLLLTSVPS